MLTNFAPAREAAATPIKLVADEFEAELSQLEPVARARAAPAHGCAFGDRVSAHARAPPACPSRQQVRELVAQAATLADLGAATGPERTVQGLRASEGGAAGSGELCEWCAFALLALDIMVDCHGTFWLLEARACKHARLDGAHGSATP